MASVQSYIPVLPSGSTDGKPVKVAATSSPGTTWHTCTSTANTYDELFLQVSNSHTSAVLCTVEIGGTTDPDNLFPKALSIPPNGTIVVLLTGFRANNGVTVKVFADSANKLILMGNVNRITVNP